MKDKISVIIPVRDRDEERVHRVVNQFDHEIFKEVILVDYGSKIPCNPGDCHMKIIRYDKPGPWNKAHAINIGMKNATADYLMTIDADILLEPGFEDKLILDENTYAYSGAVKRIPEDKASGDWRYMWDINSFPWVNVPGYAREMYGLANGGLQIYPRKFLEDWKGIDENMVYSGGMDNITNLMAKKSDMNIVQMPIKLLHIEHDNRKSDNFPEEERTLATFITSRRGDYLNDWIANPVVNVSCGSMDGPCYSTYLDELRVFMDNEPGVERSVNNINNRQAKIMIAIINNTGLLPDTFVKSLMELFQKTISKFPNTSIRFVRACQVNQMRNIAVNVAIEEDYDYIIQLDVDHVYDDDTIIKLMGYNKEFITVPTKQRVFPFLPTQYFELKYPIKQKDNYVFADGSGLLKIEASGPVAMLMKVSTLRELEFPYYWMDYSFGPKQVMGGDFVFCRQLKDKGKELYLDQTINCPHFVKARVGSFGIDAEIDIDDGQM